MIETHVRIDQLEPAADGGPNLPRAARAHEMLNLESHATQNPPDEHEPHSPPVHDFWVCPVCWDARKERLRQRVIGRAEQG